MSLGWLTHTHSTAGLCIERSAAAAAIATCTSGSFPIATQQSKSSALALQDFVTWLLRNDKDRDAETKSFGIL